MLMNPFRLNEAMVCVSMSWSPASDHRPSVQSVPLGLFCPESKAQGHLWLGRSGERGWRLLSVLVVWFLRTCGWRCHWRSSEMKKLRFSLLSDVVRLLRGTELQSAASRFSVWLTHRLSSGPGSWDFLCEGLGHSDLPVVTGAPDLGTCFLRGVVDPLGLDWGWVPRGLHLKCRSIFFPVKKFKVE